MRALRRANRTAAPATIGEPPPPTFFALEGGMAALVAGLEVRLRERGVEFRTSVAAERLGRGTDGGWIVQTSVGPCPADGVVLAVPAPVAADLIAPHDADAAALERSVEYGSVAVVTLLYPEDGVTLPPGTGFLVPRDTQSPLAAGAGEDLLLTAGTFLDRKWPHLARDGTVLLRASVGRFGDRRPEQLDDAELANRVAAELAAILSLAATPTASMVTRWRRAFPQYRVGHLLRVSGIEAAVRRLPSLAVAGASYRGVGIPACMASGREAARSVREALGGRAAEAVRRRRGGVVLPALGRRASSSPSRSPPSVRGPPPSSGPRSSIGGSGACASGPACWPAGSPGSAASPSACSGRRPSTGTGRWCWSCSRRSSWRRWPPSRRPRRPGVRLRRGRHPPRGGPADLALRRAPGRRRLPRPGRPAPSSRSPGLAARSS